MKSRSEYWKSYRERRFPYAVKSCTECGDPFPALGCQLRCQKCRTSLCPQCGKTFLTNKRGRKFCSRVCRGRSLPNIERINAHRGRKPRTYHLRKDVRHYGKTFDSEWAKAVRERDGYKCRRCGATKCKLQAHHIKPYAEFPHLRYVLSNGLTLCIPCHKRTRTFGWKKYHRWRKRESRQTAQRNLVFV
jgi:5-methylcytosine-specific restriction endonuclease McrA